MRKILLKVLVSIVFVIPVIFGLTSCKNKEKTETPPETPAAPVVTVVSIKAEVDNSASKFNYDKTSNTISVEYSTELEIEKTDLVLTATKSDETTEVVTDYVLDLSEVDGVVDVGNYKIKLTYDNKVAEINVNVYPKAIDKPTFSVVKDYTYFRDFLGFVSTYEPEVFGFDANSMKYAADSTLQAQNVGDYKVKIDLKDNYVWKNYTSSNTETVVFDWKIKRADVNAVSPENLTFLYTEGVANNITFANQSEFDKYFEIVSGTTSAIERNRYSFVVKLNENYFDNYAIVENLYFEGVDFEYNEDKTMITYYWEIL